VKGRGRRKLSGEKMSLPPEFLCYHANGARQNIKISSRFSAGRSIFLMEVMFPSLASEPRNSAADQARFLTRGADEGP
jgi:hypothetical protein